MNIKWLRQQIGFVQQEPILFEKTIKENILYGSGYNQEGVENSAYTDEKASKSNATNVNEKITEATKEANAHDFINTLPSGLDTKCGKKGSQLSGNTRCSN